MKGRVSAFGRALGASLLLVALVIGVPYLLVAAVGNPFPGSMPTLDEIRVLLTQNGQGFTNFVIGVLATLVWVIWVQLMITLIAESVATIGQRETQRLRVAPGLQSFAARLIAALTLATSLAAGPLLAPAVGALSFADAVHANPVDPVDPLALTVVDASHQVLRPVAAAAHLNDVTEATTMVVADHTELWDLAEAAYGDGLSWKLIAQANVGMPDVQGAVITSDTDTVAPGTELRLPGEVDSSAITAFGTLGAGTSSTAASVQASAVAPEVSRVVQPGDSMWSVAEIEVERRLDRPGTEAEVAEYWFDVIAANDDMSSGDIDLIYPGEALALPQDPGTVGPVGAGLPASQLETEVPSVRDLSASDLSASDQSARSAAALLDLVDGPVDNRNSVADSRRGDESGLGQFSADQPQADSGDTGEGLQPESPSPDRPSGTTAPSGSIPMPALGMAALGTALLGSGVVSAVRRRRDLQRRTRPVGTRARPASVEAAAFETAMAHMADHVSESKLGHGWRVLPASAVPALEPPATAADGGPTRQIAAPIVVHRDPRSEPDDNGWPDRLPPTVEATTTVVGTDSVSGEVVLLDLAALQRLELRGLDSDVRAVARSIVLDLAVSDRSDNVSVIAVGVGAELADLERVHPVDTFDEASALASRMGWLSPDAMDPVVVVSGDAPSGDVALSTLKGAGALIVGPQIEAELWVEIAGQHGTLEPEGRAIMLAALDDDQYRSASELIDTTSGTALEIVDEIVGVHEVLDVVTTVECSIEAGPREVKVLGPVDVAGVDSFSSLKAVDVVAYLAFHRHGVDADQIKTWVWPAFDPPTDKAFANVMSRARTGLGADADGSPYLSRAGADRTYRLADAVTTDFDRFRALVDHAEQAGDPTVALDLYRQALQLIRGVPFSGGAASSFSWADNHVRAQVEYTIDEAVHRCADMALDADDLATARWAALKGLELVPGCEQCFRRRFLIARAGNNRSELRRAMVDLEASAMIDLGEPEGVDLISGDLLDLYHELDSALVGRAS